MTEQRKPDTVLILASTRDKVGWSLEVEHDYAAKLLPVLGPRKSRRKTASVEIELHTPDKTYLVTAKCATVVVADKGEK